MRFHADWSQELLLVIIGLIIIHRYIHVACKFALLAKCSCALLINEVFPNRMSFNFFNLLITFFPHNLRKINSWRS